MSVQNPSQDPEGQAWDQAWHDLEALWKYLKSHSPFKVSDYDRTTGQITQRDEP